MLCSFFFTSNKFLWKSNITFFISCVCLIAEGVSDQRASISIILKRSNFENFFVFSWEHTLEELLISCSAKSSIIIKYDVSHCKWIITNIPYPLDRLYQIKIIVSPLWHFRFFLIVTFWFWMFELQFCGGFF